MHSLTLGLSLYGVISVTTAAVEVAIALSIAFIAVENLCREDLSRWRPWVVFGSGLVHGLGFAHTFRETSVAPFDFLPALLSFNLGIECAQLVVIGLAFTSVAVWWKRDFHHGSIAKPASASFAV